MAFLMIIKQTQYRWKKHEINEKIFNEWFKEYLKKVRIGGKSKE